MWQPVLAPLAARRTVIALDLPGFGASPAPPSDVPAGVEPLTRLVAEFIDQLGLERPHVAGNSLGGRLALELAKQGRASSVTVLSPSGFHTSAEAIYQQAVLSIAVRGARMLAPQAGRVTSRPGFRALALWPFVARPQRLSASEARDSIRALAAAPWFDATLRAIHNRPFSDGELIDVPVTIAWGENDHLLLPHQARRAARELPAATMIVLRGCGHVPTYDDPERVAKVLLEGSRD